MNEAFLPGQSDANNPTAYVIDFDPDVSRMASVLAGIGVADVHHVAAVRADQDPRWLSRRVSDPAKEIGVGAAGCLLAHRAVWRTWAALSVPSSEIALVLESDAVLTDYGRKWFRVVVETMRDDRLGVVQVGANRPENWRALTSGGGSVVNRSSLVRDLAETRLLRHRPPMLSPSFGWGTHAYLISRSASAWLTTRILGFCCRWTSGFAVWPWISATVSLGCGNNCGPRTRNHPALRGSADSRPGADRPVPVQGP